MEITKKAKQQLTASPAIIDLQGIVKRFYIGKPNELEILHGIDLQVQEGQFVSIVGESGSRQIDINEYYWCFGSADRWSISA